MDRYEVENKIDELQKLLEKTITNNQFVLNKETVKIQEEITALNIYLKKIKENF